MPCVSTAMWPHIQFKIPSPAILVKKLRVCNLVTSTNYAYQFHIRSLPFAEFFTFRFTSVRMDIHLCTHYMHVCSKTLIYVCESLQLVHCLGQFDLFGIPDPFVLTPTPTGRLNPAQPSSHKSEFLQSL